jgi:hypothetical protein
MGYDYAAYFEELHKRVGSAEAVQFRPVPLDGGEPKLNKCHDNVDWWVKGRPDTTAVRGWLFWAQPNEVGQYIFMAHSVVEENGKLFDITPIGEKERKGLVFLRHRGTEEDFEPMKKAYAQVFYPPLSMDEWQRDVIRSRHG